MCPVLPHVQHVLVSPLPPFSWPLLPFLPMALSNRLFPPSLPPFSFSSDPCHSPTFLCQFLCRQPAKQGLRSFGLPLGSHSHDLLSLPFQISIGALVSFFPASGCRDCLYLVSNDDGLQRNEQFAVRHGRSSESVVQQAFWHQFLDRISDLADVLRMSSNCSTSFALSLSEMLLISVAHAEFLSDMFL